MRFNGKPPKDEIELLHERQEADQPLQGSPDDELAPMNNIRGTIPASSATVPPSAIASTMPDQPATNSPIATPSAQIPGSTVLTTTAQDASTPDMRTVPPISAPVPTVASASLKVNNIINPATAENDEAEEEEEELEGEEEEEYDDGEEADVDGEEVDTYGNGEENIGDEAYEEYDEGEEDFEVDTEKIIAHADQQDADREDGENPQEPLAFAVQENLVSQSAADEAVGGHEVYVEEYEDDPGKLFVFVLGFNL